MWVTVLADTADLYRLVQPLMAGALGNECDGRW